MTRTAQQIIDASNDVLIKTYTAQPVVLSHGEGMYIWDTEGKKYLDFAAGIAVASLGHANAAMLKTINEQAAKIMIYPASYMSAPRLDCAKLLVSNSCFDLVFFANSGTEVVEAAIKCARKWAYENKGQDCHEIIAFRNAFHGRTMGAASLTEKAHVQDYFAPYLPGVRWAHFNDIDSVKEAITDKTAAIFIEPVQGEGGVTPAEADFLKALRALCDAENICLVFDEIQAGMGRMGTLFAYQSFGVEPDIACLAKGMGGGFPVSAMVTKKRFGDAIVVGTHGTTYGGNPLACAVAHTVIGEMLKDGFLDNVQETSAYFIEGLSKLKRSTNKITDIRGKGLMIGIDTAVDRARMLGGMQKNGLLATGAGKETIRLTPPLIAEKTHIDEALEILEKTLKEEG